MRYKDLFSKSSALAATVCVTLGSQMSAHAVCSSNSIRLNDNIEGFVASQNISDHYVLVDDCSIHIQANTWVVTKDTYTITPDTVLKFAFQSGEQEGQFHGIGFYEPGTALNSMNFFDLHGFETSSNGTQFGIPHFRYSGGYEGFSIPVGQYLTGENLQLVLVADNDIEEVGSSLFDNIRLVEVPRVEHQLNISETDISDPIIIPAPENKDATTIVKGIIQTDGNVDIRLPGNRRTVLSDELIISGLNNEHPSKINVALPRNGCVDGVGVIEAPLIADDSVSTNLGNDCAMQVNANIAADRVTLGAGSSANVKYFDVGGTGEDISIASPKNIMTITTYNGTFTLHENAFLTSNIGVNLLIDNDVLIKGDIATAGTLQVNTAIRQNGDVTIQGNALSGEIADVFIQGKTVSFDQSQTFSSPRASIVATSLVLNSSSIDNQGDDASLDLSRIESIEGSGTITSSKLCAGDAQIGSQVFLILDETEGC